MKKSKAKSSFSIYVIINENLESKDSNNKLFGGGVFLLSPNLGLSDNVKAECMIDNKICDYLSVLEKLRGNAFKTSAFRISSRNKEQLMHPQTYETIDRNGIISDTKITCSSYEIKEYISENGDKLGLYYIYVDMSIIIDSNSWINLLLLKDTSVSIDFYGDWLN